MSNTKQNSKMTAPQGGQSANHCYTQYSNISDLEIKQDIIDTQREIDNYDDELEILMRNPSENKVRIYFLKGNISQKNKFIEKLNDILSYRKQNV